MKAEDVRKNLVKIKIGEGVDTLKAYNHNVGDTLPKRTFFGVKEEAAKKIAQEIRGNERRTTVSDALGAIAATGGLLGES